MTDQQTADALNRRTFLGSASLGAIAASQLLASESGPHASLRLPVKAKRVIWLFQAGAPSQLDLLDPKPLLNERHGEQLPESVRGEQRLTGMSAAQASIPLAGSPFQFTDGPGGQRWSELLPHTAAVGEDLCVVRSMYTEAINHGPAVTFVQTGSQIPGRPSVGAWVDYGLGTENSDLPAFVVLVTKDKGGQPLVARYWGNGFLPSRHQGVRFRSGPDPVLYLNNPEGLPREARRRSLDALAELHRMDAEAGTSPAAARLSQYELAYRMQSAVPEAVDLSGETRETLELYGPDAEKPGSFAANCLLARRLAERGVRFIQLYHQGWDHHGGLPGAIRRQCKETDQPSAALITDLKRRGLLDDTLVVWGGEFGRTNYCQGKLTKTNFGRDHHPRCFSLWMAGAGVRGGTSFGSTDEYGYNVAEDGVHVHDLQATILHLLGVDHERLTYRYQGRQFRLTDVHGHVVRDVLS